MKRHAYLKFVQFTSQLFEADVAGALRRSPFVDLSDGGVHEGLKFGGHPPAMRLPNHPHLRQRVIVLDHRPDLMVVLHCPQCSQNQ